MPLCLLPDEIILNILSHIDIPSRDKKALASLCLSSRRLNALTTPLLYSNFTDNLDSKPNKDDEINKRNLRTFPLFLRTILRNPSLGSYIVHLAIKPYYNFDLVYMKYTMDVMNDADWNRVAFHVTAIKTLYPYKPKGGDWNEGVRTGRWCAVLALTLCFLTNLEKLNIRGMGMADADSDFLAAFMEMVFRTQRGASGADPDPTPLQDGRNFRRASMEIGSQKQIGKADADPGPTPLHGGRNCLGAVIQMISRTKKGKASADPKPALLHPIQGPLLPKYRKVEISCAISMYAELLDGIKFALPPSVEGFSGATIYSDDIHVGVDDDPDGKLKLSLKRICLRDCIINAGCVENLFEWCPRIEDLIISNTRWLGFAPAPHPELYMPGLQRLAPTLRLLDLDHNPRQRNYTEDMRLGPFKDFEALTHLSLWWGFLLGVRGEGLNASILGEYLPRSLESLHVHGTEINVAAISSVVRQCGDLVLNKEELALALKKVSLSVRYPHGLESICHELNSGGVAQLESLCQSKGVGFAVDSSTCLDQNHTYCHNYDLRAALFCKDRDAPEYIT